MSSCAIVTNRNEFFEYPDGTTEYAALIAYAGELRSKGVFKIPMELFNSLVTDIKASNTADCLDKLVGLINGLCPYSRYQISYIYKIDSRLFPRPLGENGDNSDTGENGESPDSTTN